MRLSLAFVLSLALAHATEQPNHNTIRQRQVRRNDTGEPQRIKKIDRDSITTNEKKDKKNKESEEETKDSKRKSKNEEAVVESKKNKKDKTAVEAEDKKGSKRSKDAVEETSKNKDKKVKEEEVKKEKRSIDQKELKNQLKEMQDVENGLDTVTIDLGDIMGGSSSQDKERKREEKKSKEAATVEIVQEESFESNMLDQEVEETTDTGLSTVKGGRHKHVGFGRKKGLKRTVGGRAGGQKLQGSISSAKAGKEDELLSFRANKYRAGGRNKTKTRGGSGKLRNIGGKSTKITTRGAAYDGKARKMLL